MAALRRCYGSGPPEDSVRARLFWGAALKTFVILFACGLCLWPLRAFAHDQTISDPAYLAELSAKARNLDLAHHRGWQVLLHYRRTMWGQVRSEADGAAFFNAKEHGKTDPELELVATLAAFAQPAVADDPGKPPEDNQHPQCRFPARWAWLQEQLQIDVARMPKQACPLFASWRQAFSAQRVTLVYASAFVNSPASMYGHTFLRLTRATGEGNPLLDYIVNFAADVDTKNGVMYAVKGLLGGFKGRFYVMPYYMKIQEYSNIESRDLWEYELSLTPAQAERLVEHTWETRSTHFDYYFFTENCSYFLLELLEAANPTLQLSSQFTWTTIPADTVRAITSVPGLVLSQTARPSLRATMFAQKASLTSSQVALAEALAVGAKQAASPLAPLPKDVQARTIDAAYARLRYKEGLTWPPTESFETKERQLLVLRGRTGVPPQEISNIVFPDAPERGHRTLRASLGTGAAVDSHTGDVSTKFIDLTLRLAIHDYLDTTRGYPEDATLEMFSARLRFVTHPQKLYLDKVTLLNIVSAAPVDAWLVSPSWKVWAGSGQAYELGCAGWDCVFLGTSTGSGLAWRPTKPWMLWAMVDLSVQGGPALKKNYRIGPGVSLGSTLRWGEWAQTELGGQYIEYLLGDTRHHPLFFAGQALNLKRRMQARLVGEAFGSVVFARFELLAYF